MSFKNKYFTKLFKLTSSLIDLHGENSFSAKNYQTAAFKLERIETPIADKSLYELTKLDGVGKSLATNLFDISRTGTFPHLEQLLSKTPEGLIKLLQARGIGAKKLRVAWQELGIENAKDFLIACEQNKISTLKSFGEKTQESIRQILNFILKNEGKFLYAEADFDANQLLKAIQVRYGEERANFSGEFRRKLDVLETVEILLATEEKATAMSFLNTLEGFDYLEKESSPFNWIAKKSEITFDVQLCKPADFHERLLLDTGSPKHLSLETPKNQSLIEVIKTNAIANEAEAYELAGLQYVPPELREGSFEVEKASKKELPLLIELTDLKGVLHSHSTYSDGIHTLKQMAQHCRNMGYEYLGISDHSQAAFYANGLSEEAVLKQHVEIDELNRDMAPFKIFKGIESDILHDGSLDYHEEVLASFDFVISSVHSNLNMNIDKATSRLIAAIENPYTTILGHPTGRLLLKREGYPIDHKAIINACAKNDVIIEINANPQRLDLDWHWVRYALDQNVLLSINPDAHETEGCQDMYFGLLVGRKGGLTKSTTFNAFSVSEVEKYFKRRKTRAKLPT